MEQQLAYGHPILSNTAMGIHLSSQHMFSSTTRHKYTESNDLKTNNNNKQGIASKFTLLIAFPVKKHDILQLQDGAKMISNPNLDIDQRKAITLKE